MADTIYTSELGTKICLLISEGYSLRAIAKVSGMPCKATIMNWCISQPDFLDQYTRAKEQQAEAFNEDLIEIADDGANDWMEKFDKDGQSAGWVLNGEHVQRSKLRIEARKWLMGKMKPKKYGDKITSEITGANGGPIEYTDAKAALLRRTISTAPDGGADRED